MIPGKVNLVMSFPTIPVKIFMIFGLSFGSLITGSFKRHSSWESEVCLNTGFSVNNRFYKNKYNTKY